MESLTSFDIPDGYSEVSSRAARKKVDYTDPGALAFAWSEILRRYGDMSSIAADVIGAKMEHHKFPTPSGDAHVYLTPEALEDIGISDLGDHARVMLACKRMPATHAVGVRRVQVKAVVQSSPPASPLHNAVSETDLSESTSVSTMAPTRRVFGDGHGPEVVTTHRGQHLLGESLSTVALDASEVFLHRFSGVEFKWYDLVGKDTAEGLEIAEYPRTCDFWRCLSKIRKRFHDKNPTENITPNSIFAILNTTLPLPHLRTGNYSSSGNVQFSFVLRATTPVEDISGNDDNIRDLTNRWTVFVDLTNNLIATVHRVDSKSLSKLRGNFAATCRELSLEDFMAKVVEMFIADFDSALEAQERQLDYHEERLMHRTSGSRDLIEQLFCLERRCTVFKRMLELARRLQEDELTPELDIPGEKLSAKFRGSVENAKSLAERANTLLDLQLSLVSFATNDFMKVLTKFSISFTPLTFIAGVYGMNFHNMPELTYEYGYYICLGVMGFFGILIQLIFWIRDRPPKPNEE